MRKQAWAREKKRKKGNRKLDVVNVRSADLLPVDINMHRGAFFAQ